MEWGTRGVSSKIPLASVSRHMASFLNGIRASVILKRFLSREGSPGMFQTEMRFPGSSADEGERMVKEPVARQSSPKHRGRSFAQRRASG
jgi:hypothetical protein